MKFRSFVTPRVTGNAAMRSVYEQIAPTPPDEDAVTKVPAYTVLKGLNVGRNRKHRMQIIDGMAKKARAKDRKSKRSKK